MGAFEYRQAQEMREALARHRVRYLFIAPDLPMNR